MTHEFGILKLVNYLRTQVLKFKFLSLFLISFVVALILAGNQDFKNWLLGLGQLEYFGAFLAGIFFVSSFSVATSTVIISILSENMHPALLGLLGGLGAMVGDYLVYLFLKDHLFEELKTMFGQDGTSYVRALVRSKYISWTLPIIGILIIASPLPDELGVGLLGLSKISKFQFMLVTFLSNAFGILAIASVAKVF